MTHVFPLFPPIRALKSRPELTQRAVGILHGFVVWLVFYPKRESEGLMGSLNDSLESPDREDCCLDPAFGPPWG